MPGMITPQNNGAGSSSAKAPVGHSVDELRRVVQTQAKQLAEEKAKVNELKEHLRRTQGVPPDEAFAQEARKEQRAEATAKVLTREIDPDPREAGFEVLTGLMSETEKADAWYKVTLGYDWKVEIAASLVKAVKLAKRCQLGLGSRLSKTSGNPETVGQALIRKGGEIESLIEDGTVTELGKVLIKALTDAFGEAQVNAVIGKAPPVVDGEKPIWALPGPGRTITEAFAELHAAIERTNANVLFRRRDGQPCELVIQGGEHTLRDMRPEDFAGFSERFVVPGQMGKHGFLKQSLTLPTAKLMINYSNTRKLKVINSIVAHPPLIRRPDDSVVVLGPGFDSETGIYVTAAKPLPKLGLDEAIRWARSLEMDFFFQSDGDRSRHLAGFFTPGLFMGRFLRGKHPIDVTEAQESQTGKDYRVQLIGGTYGERFSPVTQGESGVGKGIDEAFDTAVTQGRPFILIDNLRGPLHSQKIEAFITLSAYSCRILRRSVEVDPHEFSIFVTSNEAEFTRDMVNRALVTRLLMAPKEHKFWHSKKGLELMDFVTNNQSRYLAAIYAIITDWWTNHFLKGSGTTDEHRHPFRETIGVLDFIVQQYFELPPLLTDYEGIVERTVDKFKSWARKFCIAAKMAKRLNEWLAANEIVRLCEAKRIPVPGAENESKPDVKYRRIGHVFAALFQDDRHEEPEQQSRVLVDEDNTPDRSMAEEKVITIEGFRIRHRQEWVSDKGRDRNLYLVEADLSGQA
jgi:hypothetical protein